MESDVSKNNNRVAETPVPATEVPTLGESASISGTKESFWCIFDYTIRYIAYTRKDATMEPKKAAPSPSE